MFVPAHRPPILPESMQVLHMSIHPYHFLGQDSSPAQDPRHRAIQETIDYPGSAVQNSTDSLGRKTATQHYADDRQSFPDALDRASLSGHQSLRPGCSSGQLSRKAPSILSGWDRKPQTGPVRSKIEQAARKREVEDTG